MPDTIRSGRSPTSPRSPKRTQSTGVPSVANPVLPSRSSTSDTASGRSMVMLRAEPLRLASGAITETVPWRSSACLAANRPREVMPSSLVSRMCTRLSLWRAGSGVWLQPDPVHPRPAVASLNGVRLKPDPYRLHMQIHHEPRAIPAVDVARELDRVAAAVEGHPGDHDRRGAGPGAQVAGVVGLAHGRLDRLLGAHRIDPVALAH